MPPPPGFNKIMIKNPPQLQLSICFIPFDQCNTYLSILTIDDAEILKNQVRVQINVFYHSLNR